MRKKTLYLLLMLVVIAGIVRYSDFIPVKYLFFLCKDRDVENNFVFPAGTTSLANRVLWIPSDGELVIERGAHIEIDNAGIVCLGKLKIIGDAEASISISGTNSRRCHGLLFPTAHLSLQNFEISNLVLTGKQIYSGISPIAYSSNTDAKNTREVFSALLAATSMEIRNSAIRNISFESGSNEKGYHLSSLIAVAEDIVVECSVIDSIGMLGVDHINGDTQGSVLFCAASNGGSRFRNTSCIISNSEILACELSHLAKFAEIEFIDSIVKMSVVAGSAGIDSYAVLEPVRKFGSLRTKFTLDSEIEDSHTRFLFISASESIETVCSITDCSFNLKGIIGANFIGRSRHKPMSLSIKNNSFFVVDTKSAVATDSSLVFCLWNPSNNIVFEGNKFNSDGELKLTVSTNGSNNSLSASEVKLYVVINWDEEEVLLDRWKIEADEVEVIVGEYMTPSKDPTSFNSNLKLKHCEILANTISIPEGVEIIE